MKPQYTDPLESRAYDRGYSDAWHGYSLTGGELDPFPNAYFKGYHEGEADRKAHDRRTAKAWRLGIGLGLLTVAGLIMLAWDGRSEIPHQNMAGPILQEKNGRSDFAGIYWLIDLRFGTTPTVELVDDFPNALDCHEEAFTRDLPAGVGYSTCIGTDEPAELLSARALVSIMDGLIIGP